MEGKWFPRHAQPARGAVQGTATATTATTASVPAGKHDGTSYDAKPYGTTVHDATDDDACARADAHDAATANAAAADDGATTADDGTDDAGISRGATAATGRAASGPTAALCWIWSGNTDGEEFLTVRGGQTGSFKQ